ncbi:MAG TPA: hypothetical protein VMV52_10495 [Candidatus Nanopelagicaceae bacterium]|nr:hypothetical protein [Candidatus Nanopelagicaceae bacterium]
MSRRFWGRCFVNVSATPESGSVTAELATALPAIVLVGGALLDLFAAMALYLHSSQVAQRAAEAITRHEEMANVVQMVERALPSSHLVIVDQGDYSLVRIETSAPWPKSLKINASAIAHN